MTADKTPEENSEEKAHVNIDDFRDIYDGDGGMTYERHKEIANAIAEGRHDLYTSEEKTEFDEHNQSLKDILGAWKNPMKKPFENVFANSRWLFGKDVATTKSDDEEKSSAQILFGADPEAIKRNLLGSTYPKPVLTGQHLKPLFTPEQQADIERSKQERDKQTKDRTDSLIKMAEIMIQESKASKTRYEVSLWIGAATVVVGLAAAVFAGLSLQAQHETEPVPPAAPVEQSVNPKTETEKPQIPKE